MLRLRMLGIAMFVVFPLLTSATQISELGGTASVPSAVLITWAGSSDFQWSTPPAAFRIADESITIDTQGYTSPFLPGLFSTDPSVGKSAPGAVSLGESESGSRLSLAILIFIAFAALLKGFPSPV